MQDQNTSPYGILDHLLEGCQVVDHDWRYRYMNDAAVMHARKERDELVGRKMCEVYPGIESTSMFATLRECMETRAEKGLTNQFFYPDGTYAWYDLHVTPVEEGILILSWDISEQKNAEETLRRSAETLKTVIETSPIAMMATDLQGKIQIFNQAAEETFGWKANEVIGKPNPIIHPEHRKEVQQVRRDILAGHSIYNRETESLHKDGHTIQILFSATPLLDGEGKISGILSVSADITEPKRAAEEIHKLNAELEQRVEERTAELSDLYNNAPCGYHSLDAEGKIIFINDTELKWLGRTREEIVGKAKITDFFTPESKRIFSENFPQFKQRGWVNDLEFEIIRKDGTILPILLSGTAIYDQDGRYAMSRSTMIDHTAKKRAEVAMLEAQARLEASNKELEAFAYSVSHDLRAPLRHIAGYVELFKEHTKGTLDEQGKHYLDTISEAASRMGELIDNLLSFSRIGRMELIKIKIDFAELVREAKEECRPDMDGREVLWEIGELPVVYGDRSLLRQVWINLIANALKYTRPRPKVEIQIGSTRAETEDIFFIRDNGVGFDMRYVDKLFGVFQRLHRANEFEGIGIGLANVSRIVQRHGGRVWAEGALDQGATFFFTLPRE